MQLAIASRFEAAENLSASEGSSVTIFDRLPDFEGLVTTEVFECDAVEVLGGTDSEVPLLRCFCCRAAACLLAFNVEL